MNKLGKWCLIIRLIAFGFLGAYLGSINIHPNNHEFWLIVVPAVIINICSFFEGGIAECKRRDKNDW